MKVIGSTPEEQAETLAQLEAKETKAKVLMEEVRSILDEVFAHLPEDDAGPGCGLTGTNEARTQHTI